MKLCDTKNWQIVVQWTVDMYFKNIVLDLSNLKFQYIYDNSSNIYVSRFYKKCGFVFCDILMAINFGK